MPAFVLLVITILLSQSVTGTVLPDTGNNMDANRRSGDIHIGLRLAWIGYASWSQQKNDMRMRRGFPVLLGQFPALGARVVLATGSAQHEILAECGIPGSLTSDNGTGRNLLLDEAESGYFRAGVDYRLHWPLLSWHSLQLRHGMTAGLRYEYRDLVYASGMSERSRDAGISLGPALDLALPIDAQWSVRLGFDAHFHLPWLNYGKLSKRDAEGRRHYEASYRAFYYQTLLMFTVRHGRYAVQLRRDDLLGFAGRKADFDMEGMVHHKIDRLYSVHVEVAL